MEYFDLSGNRIDERELTPRRSAPQNNASRRSTAQTQQKKQQAAQPRRSAPRNVRRPVNQKAAVRSAQKERNQGRSSATKEELKKFVNFRIPQKFDFSFFMIIIILLAFGLVMLFSASYAAAKEQYDNSYYFINRQLIFAALGFAAMIALSFIDYHLYANKFILNLAIVLGVGLMLLVKVMGITVGGAERWLMLFGVQFQPSELLKFVNIMVIAEYMQRNYDIRGDFWKGFFPLVVRIGISCGLVILQPHLSCTVIILFTSICMLTIGGTKFRHLALIVGGIVVGAFIIMKIFPMMGLDYVSARMLSFQNPEADIQGKTYQTYQSLVTIGSGGMFGLGLGNSRQKYGYLPVTQNDFIFSVICEELGFIGAMALIILFMVFLFRGLYIASAAPDKFGMLLCAGIVIHLAIQALLNIAVVSNAIPNTGISLPFISYGGTALVVQMAEIGIVLNISRKAAMD